MKINKSQETFQPTIAWLYRLNFNNRINIRSINSSAGGLRIWQSGWNAAVGVVWWKKKLNIGSRRGRRAGKEWNAFDASVNAVISWMRWRGEWLKEGGGGGAVCWFRNFQMFRYPRWPGGCLGDAEHLIEAFMRGGGGVIMTGDKLCGGQHPASEWMLLDTSISGGGTGDRGAGGRDRRWKRWRKGCVLKIPELKAGWTVWTERGIYLLWCCDET